MIIRELLKDFYEKFYVANNKCNIFFAPGRVNLIGGHVDYHGGSVLPCAINYGTYLVISKRDDNEVYGFSKNFKDIGILRKGFDNLEYDESDNWFNYPKGIIKNLINKGYKMPNGFNMLFYGNIPNGAGLSSSASLELVILMALNSIFDLKLTKIEMVLIAKEVENDYIGVNCGIMDQYAVAFGKKNYAILLDCENVKHEYVALNLDDYKIMIVNSNKQRKLSDSKYNKRRSESYLGLKKLMNKANKNSISELDVSDFEKYSDEISDEIQRKRSKHVIYENYRTKKASKLLQENDLVSFGKLITASHYSLKNDYEVSCNELDYLVEILENDKDVIGSRMTGAGFGGCTVNIVNDKEIERITNKVNKMYYEKFGFKPSIYIANVVDGCKEVKLESISNQVLL
jgi:galactokinase